MIEAQASKVMSQVMSYQEFTITENTLHNGAYSFERWGVVEICRFDSSNLIPGKRTIATSIPDVAYMYTFPSEVDN